MIKNFLSRSAICMGFFMMFAPAVFAYSDVKSSDWFYNDVDWAQAAGYIDTGVSFFPQRSVNRAEFSKMIVKTFQIKLPLTSEETFTDVPANAWFGPSVYALKLQGVVQGKTETTFDPDAFVTREQAAKMLFLASGLSTNTNDATKFSDVDATQWAYPYIQALSAMHVIQGYSDQTFRPTQNINRAEAIVLLHRIYTRKYPTAIPSTAQQTSGTSTTSSPSTTQTPSQSTQPSGTTSPSSGSASSVPSPSADNIPVTFAGPSGLMLTGRLYKPTGNGPFSAVVFMHGCSGLLTNNGDIGSEYVYWGQYMRDHENTVGIFVDSFTPRNILSGVCGQDILDEAVERPKDAYAALSYLRTLPYIKANKIAIMGWSNGGSATLSSVAKDNNPVQIPAEGGFVGAVAEYPGCGLQSHYNTDYSTSTSLTKGTYIPYVNTSIYAAQNDTTTPPDPKCTNLVARAKTLGASTQTNNNITLTIYPGAQHGFDRAKEAETSWTAADFSARDQARTSIFAFLHLILN